jgi:hypothetical protein
MQLGWHLRAGQGEGALSNESAAFAGPRDSVMAEAGSVLICRTLPSGLSSLPPDCDAERVHLLMTVL